MRPSEHPAHGFSGQPGLGPLSNGRQGFQSCANSLRADAGAGLVIRLAGTTSTQRFQINSQTLAALAFFIAKRLYSNKDTAMAVALSLECTLYWDYFAAPGSGKASDVKTEAGVSLLTSQDAGQHKWEWPRESLNTAEARSRVQDVFSPSSLHAGMAVLLRTEVDRTQGWNKCWSLGRVLRIITARRSIDVVWLKPVNGAHLPAETIFSRRWVPWTFQEDEDFLPQEWKSRGVSMSSVQYGVWCPKDGYFDAETQATLGAEVARLEALSAEENRESNFATQALRKNSHSLRGRRV